MPTSEAQKRATQKYQAANRDRLADYHKEYESQFANLKIRMTKEQKEIVSVRAAAAGKSINQYVVDVLTE